MKHSQNTLSLTAVLVEDSKIGGYTSFFAQLPNIIAEGDTDKEAVDNLISLVKSVFKYQQKEAKTSNKYTQGHKIKTRAVDVNILFPA